MAALINHVLSKNFKFLSILSSYNSNFVQTRSLTKKKFKQTRNKVQLPECRKLKSTEDSIASKGFLRCYQEYQPPEDLKEKLADIYQQVCGQISDKNEKIEESHRFLLFNQCFKEFQHSIPNSILHTINSYGDLLTFYSTPVDATLPLEKFKTVTLPPNLHIQYEPVRFHPDEDTKFNGQTAFPKTNILVTGIRTRRKYKDYVAVNSWPDH